jgi:hypothetical protein
LGWIARSYVRAQKHGGHFKDAERDFETGGAHELHRPDYQIIAGIVSGRDGQGYAL